MKTISGLILSFLLFCACVSAQDTLYVLKADSSYVKFSIADVKQISFTRPQGYNNLTDSEGNIYHWVTIGKQTWMVENLKTTHYRNGDLVANVTDNAIWSALKTGAWSDQFNSADYGATYGHLYNWFAVNDARNIAPVGWHVATAAEWETLSTFLGGDTISGAKLKDIGTSLWRSPNIGATNDVGFKALPGGLRMPDGTFLLWTYDAYWWTSTEKSSTNAWFTEVDYQSRYLTIGDGYIFSNKNYGFSVRCVRDEVPSVIATQATSITKNSASCGGTVTYDGGLNIINRGVCWSTSQNPTIDLNNKTSDGTGAGNFVSSITGLTPNTTYHVRAYATNSKGTSYSDEIVFTTVNAPNDITDIDGNIYTQVSIGTQTWMVENLKVTHYRNGDPIANVTDNTAWSTLTTGAWSDQFNTASFGTQYGHLYNWYAVKDNRNIAPVGWHVATLAEWQTLSSFLGGDSVSGGKLKEASTSFWRNPNFGATNEVGFTALPGGLRMPDGTSLYWTYDAYWWTSTEKSATNAWFTDIDHQSKYLSYNDGYINSNKNYGMSVRCVKDQSTVQP